MNKKIVLSLVAAGLISSVNAMEFKPVGYKAVGMGGAGVASTRGSLAGYYNPAMLRFSDYTTEVSINAGVRVQENSLIESMDQLNELDFQNTIDVLSDNAENSAIFVQSKVVGTELVTADTNIDLTTNVYSQTFGTTTVNVTYEDAIKITRGDTGYGANDTVDGSGGLLTYGQVVTAVNAGNSGVSIDQDNSQITLEGKDFTIDGNDFNYEQASSLNTSQKAAHDEAIANMKDAIDILTKEIGAQNGFILSVTPSFAVQATDAFAIGAYSNVDVGLRFNIDENYNQLITKQTNNNGDEVYYKMTTDESSQYNYTVTLDDPGYSDSSIEYANDNGKNYVQIDSLVFAEVPISYAYLLDTKYGSWSIGGSLKPMQLQSYSDAIELGEDSGDAADKELDDFETTYESTIGVDLGLAFRPKDSGLTVGLVAKNVNTPTFKVDESKTGITDDYKIEPMVRAGISMPVWNNNIEFALDVDLTANETFIEGEESQYVGGGIELNPASWFAFRLGAMQDIAAETLDGGTILTTGLGFGLKWLQLDISAMVGSEKGTYDGNDIPRYTQANFSLVSRWGTGYNRKAPVEKAEELPAHKMLNESEKNKIQSDAANANDELSPLMSR